MKDYQSLPWILIFVVFLFGCGKSSKSSQVIDIATKCEGRSCPKNWTNEHLTLFSCGRDVSDAKLRISENKIYAAIRKKVSDDCDLKCNSRAGCTDGEACVEQSNNVSRGALLAPGWSCQLIGDDDACPQGKKKYQCTGKFASFRGNVFCKCAGNSLAFVN